MSKAMCPICNGEMFEFKEEILNKTFFNCTKCSKTFELNEVKTEPNKAQEG